MTPEMERMRILVVDDEEAVRGILAQLLSEDGHEVTPAASGEEGLMLFRQDPFPIVITDIRMRRMNGIELLQTIKEEVPETEVIIITSFASMQTAIQALRAGVYDYLIKPFEELDLVTSVVRRAAERIRLHAENRTLFEALRRKNEELEGTNRILAELATNDGLTGLYNHRHFHEILAAEFARTVRHDHPLSLLFLDVDHFKRYNDTHGHLKGDRVLEKIGEIIRNSLRASDMAARYGGEEFVVLLPETPMEHARHVAEQIRKRIENHPFPGRETQPEEKLTVSIGVAGYPQDGKNARELIECVDRALYEAKEMGRNQVRLKS